MKKKKRTGSVALPFLITFLISLVIIGFVAMMIYGKVTGNDSSLISMVNEVGTLSSEDDHTLLFVLDMSDTIGTSYGGENEEDYYSEEGWESEEQEYRETVSSYQPYTFMIMRSRPVDKSLTFIGIPSNMLIGNENKQAQDIYLDKGVTSLKSSIEHTLDLAIDRYMVFNTESFKKVCNVLGGVTYAAPERTDEVDVTKEEQYLSAEQVESIISWGGYSGGEMQRISTASSLLTAMVNQTSGERIAGNLDNSFNAIIDAVQSDVSVIDYNNRKYAIKFMLKYSDPTDDSTRSTRAEFITPYGTQGSTGFVADTFFAQELKPYFESDKDQPASDSASDTQADTTKNAEE